MTSISLMSSQCTNTSRAQCSLHQWIVRVQSVTNGDDEWWQGQQDQSLQQLSLVECYQDHKETLISMILQALRMKMLLQDRDITSTKTTQLYSRSKKSQRRCSSLDQLLRGLILSSQVHQRWASWAHKLQTRKYPEKEEVKLKHLSTLKHEGLLMLNRSVICLVQEAMNLWKKVNH